MRFPRKSLLVLASGFITLVLAACDRPMEKTGRAIDKAVEKTGDKIQDVVK